jgi:hypothetical protein
MAAQRFVTALAQRPQNRIHDVRFTAAVWPHDGRDAGTKLKLRIVCKGFKTRKCEAF